MGEDAQSDPTKGETLIQQREKDSMELCFSWTQTIVVWNTDDYPIPIGADVGSIHGTIDLALYRMGFEDLDKILVNGENLSDEIISDLSKTTFDVPEGCGKNPAAIQLIRELLTSVINFVPFTPISIVVMAKLSHESELKRVLTEFDLKNFPIVVVDPTPVDSSLSLFDCIAWLVDSAKVFGT